MYVFFFHFFFRFASFFVFILDFVHTWIYLFEFGMPLCNNYSTVSNFNKPTCDIPVRYYGLRAMITDYRFAR